MVSSLREKYSKLNDPPFYIDFAGRYARRGLSFFDTLECACSFLGFIGFSVLALFLYVQGSKVLMETQTAPLLYGAIIILCLIAIVWIMIHTGKERPRWRIAQYYRNISRCDVYGLEKIYIHAKTIEDMEVLMNNIRGFQEKFPIKESALATLVYNECLIARGERPILLNTPLFERIFPRFYAFLLHTPLKKLKELSRES